MTPKSHPDCQVCRKHKASVGSLRQRYRQAGGCYYCGKPCEKFAACGTCRRNMAARARLRRAKEAAWA